ncbi:MAG: type II toxin-antitoxin system RelE/ParE family toxin [Isosphaeraceae bacterium]|nr:type II toxin-antitoxin system RelE/ParE family toxin [Isosphaeraceae bacterium]
MTLTAQRSLLAASERWQGFLAVAIEELADSPEPDGRTRIAAPRGSTYDGCTMYLVPPWRVVYQVVRDTVYVIAIHPISM